MKELENVETELEELLRHQPLIGLGLFPSPPIPFLNVGDLDCMSERGWRQPVPAERRGNVADRL